MSQDAADPKLFAIDIPADMNVYEDLLDDRPMKLTVKASSYHKAKKDEPTCADCIHFFVNVVRNITVCEVVRPPEDLIEPLWTCKFQTRDGEHFPLFKGENK